MKYLLVIALAGLLTSGKCAADNPGQQQTYIVEPIGSLSMSEIWALGEAQRVEVGDLVVLSQKYDAEYGFTRRGLTYCAVFLVGSMDIGSRPAGFRVLTHGGCAAALVLKDASSEAGEFSVVLGSAGTVRVQVSKKGEIRIDGRKKGTLPQ